MKKTIIILILISSVFLFSADWSAMTRSQKIDYLKELMNSSNYKDLVKYGEMLIAEGKPKKADFNYAETYNLTAIGCKNTGNYSKAEEYYKKAADIHKNELFNKSNYGLVMKNLGTVYYEQLKYSEMADSYRKALEALEDDNLFGFNDEDISFCSYWLGFAYNRTEKYDSAMVYANKAIEIDSEEFGEYSIETGTDYLVLANAYSGKYDRENAKKYFRKSISILEYLDDDEMESVDLGVSYNDFGVFFVENYEYDSAVYYYKKSLAVYENGGGEADKAITYYNLGQAYSYKYNYEQAKNYYEKAYNSYKSEYGEYDSRTKDAKKYYDEMKSKTSSSSTYDYNDTGSSNNYSYAETKKKSGCMDKFEGCLGIFKDLENKPFSIKLAADYMQSAGKYYVGGGLGIYANGAGLSGYYYWSPTAEGGTTQRHIPLVYSFGFGGFSYEFSLDIPSLFDNSYSNNKAAPKPVAFGAGASMNLFRFINVKCQYIWGPGGYLPRGLSLNAGIEFFI